VRDDDDGGSEEKGKDRDKIGGRRLSARQEFLEVLRGGNEKVQNEEKNRNDMVARMIESQDDFHKKLLDAKEKDRRIEGLKFLLQLNPQDQVSLEALRKLLLE